MNSVVKNQTTFENGNNQISNYLSAKLSKPDMYSVARDVEKMFDNFTIVLICHEKKKNSLSAILGVLEFKKNVGQFLKSVDIKSHCKQVFIFYDIFEKLSPNSSIHSSKMY